MSFFHFNTLRKYTASLLNLFNNIEIENKLSNGKLKYTKIPIQYSNREKFDVFNQLTYNQVFTGNTQILPRGILLFTGMQQALERGRNKFVKIYKKILEKDEKKYKLNYQFNSIPYNFNYQVLIQCRGMNEASMVIEQVCSYFNPSYCLRIQEIDLPEFGYTSLILNLNDTQIEQVEMDEFSTNIVTITFDLTLKGNIYPSIKEQETIQLVQMFLSTSNFIKNENKEIEQIEQVERVRSESYNEEQKFINDYKTAIIDLIYNDEKIAVKLDSKCEKYIKFQFDWYVNGILQDTHYDNLNYKIKEGDVIKVKAYTDMVESDFFEKTFFVENIPNEILVIKDIVYEDNYLECQLEDELSNNIKTIISYKYFWFIDGIQKPQTQRIIKYSSNKVFNVKVIVESSDGRKCEKYKKIYPLEYHFKDNITLNEEMKIEDFSFNNLNNEIISNENL